jgi:hypothetical protein
MATRDDRNRAEIECPVCGVKLAAQQSGSEEALNAHLRSEHETTAKAANPKPI